MPASEGAEELQTAPPAAAALARKMDWLWNTETISGPAGSVGRFRTVARGTSSTPWHVDLDVEEMRLLAPMTSAGIEARLLARELSDMTAFR